MVAAGKFSRKWDAVKKEADPMRAIGLAVDIADEAIVESELERAELRQAIKALTKVISGNGDPTHSVVARMERLEAEYQTSCADLREIRMLLKGDLSTKKDSLLDKIDALDDRLATVERALAKQDKVMWIIIAAVVTEVVMKIIGLL